jgi:hypothetical protein
MRGNANRAVGRIRFGDVALLLGIAMAAMALHGYHPYVEDAEIYLPGIKKLLHPALYQQNPGFFASHAGMTMFPNLIAASVRLTHLPFDWALLLWQFLCIFLLLLGCWRVGRLVATDPRARWGGVALVASLLTLPVAGTRLFIMDQYLSSRSLSAAAVMMLVASAGERRYAQAVFWALFTAAVHPLMFVFAAAFVSVHFLLCVREEWTGPRANANVASASVAMLVPAALTWPYSLAMKIFPPMTPMYHRALQTRSYFFLSQWAWYEWLGLLAPFAIFWLFAKIARKRGLVEMERMCRALIWFGLIFALASLLTMATFFERFTLLQPMRYLHLTYILMFLFAGCLLVEFFLQGKLWRWLALLVPLCAGMLYAQRQSYPATPQLELPGVMSPNPWVRSFLWIRQNTPEDAYFALNPELMRLPGEDHHGFRALSERSKLAGARKDSGAVTMFPALAATWKAQTDAAAGWTSFHVQDFSRLKQQTGVGWVVVEMADSQAWKGLHCPYRNDTVAVCRLD